MTTTYNRSNAFNSLLKKSSNTFRVGDSYRTNSLSNKPGGVSVKAVFADGTSRIYDKIKNSDAYINHLLNYSNDDIVSAHVIDDDDFFDWD
jgi:hypothetical protein